MKFRQHVPGFVDLGEEKPFEIEGTFEEIMNNEWIKSFADDPRHHRWSFSPQIHIRSPWKGCLMHESHGGKKWWVVGYLDEVPPLPEWESPTPPEKAA